MESKVNVVIEKRNEEKDTKRFKGYILGLRKVNAAKREQEGNKS